MKHDTSLPTQPCPLPAPFFFLTRICCTLTLNFLHYISHIFSSWNSNCLGPCVFFSHVKIQKSHIIKTHNCCGSIKRELKRKGKKKNSEVHRQNVLYISVFTLQTRWRVHRVPFQYRMRGWLDISKAEVQPDKVYKINPSSSGVLFMGDKMGEHKQTNKQKKVPQEKKNNYSLRNPFFLQVVAKVF